MKQAIITGAGSGLGRALAFKYAEADYHIILVGRNLEKLNTVKEELEYKSFSSEIATCDITDWEEVKSLSEKYKSIDLLINNAGIGYFNTVDQLKKEEIDTMINVNVNGLIYITKLLLPAVLHAKGRILNIISTAGLKGKVQESAYCASKFAQRGFTESLQKELTDDPISISAVYMGGMNTPFWNDSDYVSDPSILPSPEGYASQIIEQDDGREEIHVEK